jgi:hypothetical protein
VTGPLDTGSAASALFMTTGSLQAESGRMVDLGAAEPVLEMLSYGDGEVGKYSVLAQWRLSAARRRPEALYLDRGYDHDRRGRTSGTRASSRS